NAAGCRPRRDLACSILPVRHDARPRHGVPPVGIGQQRRGGLLRELPDAGRELVPALEHFLEGDLPPRVGGHASHVADKAGLDAALGLVVRPVVAYGVNQVVPFVLVWICLVVRNLRTPYQALTAEVAPAVDAGWQTAVGIARDDRRALRAEHVA